MAEQHPIQGIMYTAMQSLKEIVDVNTIVGEPVNTPDGTVIIPISKVGLGFGVGGTEFEGNSKLTKTVDDEKGKMFGGGTGGGVSVSPVAFLVVGNGQIRLLPVNPETTVYDRLLDMVPSAIDKLCALFEKDKTESVEENDDFDAEDYLEIIKKEEEM